MPKRLVWADDGKAIVRTVDELDELLDDLEQLATETEPFIVELSAEEGPSITMGVGRSQSVLGYMSGSSKPPYYQSAGRDINEEDMVFFYRGQWTNFPPGSAVATKDGRAALRSFFETEALPDNVVWEEI